MLIKSTLKFIIYFSIYIQHVFQKSFCVQEKGNPDNIYMFT